ncbi:hypothetical protein A1F94_008221 [Pyrenophora tritici-repentis]|nr:hypothetical protein A1F94_008221 [Pyrenophora tritici-repentis]PWO20752.1 hypothetical protein PtrARCrB10_10738 [Pyrenophora tritici-repentis]
MLKSWERLREMSQACSAVLAAVSGFIYQDAFRNSIGPRGASHTPVGRLLTKRTD